VIDDGSQRKYALEMFRDAEMRTCHCCHPLRSRTIITLDPSGREQFTCPKSRITMRYSEGAQTYLQGSILGSGASPVGNEYGLI